jgi:hypothetical protein
MVYSWLFRIQLRRVGEGRFLRASDKSWKFSSVLDKSLQSLLKI